MALLYPLRGRWFKQIWIYTNFQRSNSFSDKLVAQEEGFKRFSPCIRQLALRARTTFGQRENSAYYCLWRRELFCRLNRTHYFFLIRWLPMYLDRIWDENGFFYFYVYKGILLHFEWFAELSSYMWNTEKWYRCYVNKTESFICYTPYRVFASTTFPLIFR